MLAAICTLPLSVATAGDLTWELFAYETVLCAFWCGAIVFDALQSAEAQEKKRCLFSGGGIKPPLGALRRGPFPAGPGSAPSVILR